MPSTNASLNGRTRTFNARPDRYDIRDRCYQPRLVNLPPTFPAPEVIEGKLKLYKKLVLDQGSEGACTGFALAAMINYLRFKDGVLMAADGKEQMPEKVSARMLYEHARLYDEWPGEDYDGSSCRGALKGWHRHGVCLEETWPYLSQDGSAGRPATGWAEEAAKITLGAYYRIETDDITALQSAIHEVGAVYVSASVHKGWEVPENAKVLPVIQWRSNTKVNGLHAFALVGYRDDGFIVQNSWGPTWGFYGFALLPYSDWIVHGTDAWVSTLGVERMNVAVPTNYSSSSLNVRAGSGQTGSGALVNGAADLMEEDKVRSHCMVVGNDGILLRASGAYTVNEWMKEVLIKRVREWMSKSSKRRQIAIYAHGGLNDESAGIKRAQVMAPCFLANDIYPIFIVWKTGWHESLKDIGVDLLKKVVPGEDPVKQAGGFLGWAKEKISDGWDYTVETTLAVVGKALWWQMKQNAEASVKRGHSADLLAGELVKLRAEFSDCGIHLMGHSAGSIWQGELISALGRQEGGSVKIDTCHLFAPACTVGFANEHFKKAVEAQQLSAKKFFITNLSDGAERADNVAGFYGKSLLYFVSRACEKAHKTPILGMEAAWNKSLDNKEDVFNEDFEAELATWRKFANNTPLLQPDLVREEAIMNDGKKASPPSHGGFDNDIATMTTALKRILGLGKKATLQKPINSLVGF